jgi:hypothetical protein
VGLSDRLRRLEATSTEPERQRDPEVRARMKAVLDELADARREGRPPSREAREVSEALEERRRRGA